MSVGCDKIKGDKGEKEKAMAVRCYKIKGGVEKVMVVGCGKIEGEKWRKG